ncbi:MAG: sugar phosphate permease [Acidimicrobiales bacterium]|jgi:sugar phosphate permease
MLDAGPVTGEGRTRHYAWVILGVAFLGLLGAQGVRLAFGAFLEPWEVDFNLSRGAVAGIGAVSYLVYGAAQPLVGLITDRVNLPRLFAAGMVVIAIGLLLVANSTTGLGLTIAYGLVSSIGFGISASVVASVLITRWFVARRGLAFGILEAGFGAGQLTLAPLSLFAITRWGWQPTMVGFAVFLGLFLAPLMVLLLKNRPEDVGLEPLGGPDPEVGEERTEGNLALLKRVEFWYLGIPFFFCGVTTTGMIDTHLIPFSHDHGNGDGITSVAVGVLALFNIIGTAGSGLLVDKYDPRHLLGWLYALRAVSLVLVLMLNQGFWLIQFGVLFGLVDFATVAPTQTLVSRYFGGRALGFVFGLILFSHQIGSAVGSYVPGRIHDVTGSYSVAFLGAALTLVAASFLSFRLPRLR